MDVEKVIHELFTLTRPLFCIDLETTSLRWHEARIIEIGLLQFTAEGLVKEWCGRVNPGVSIPPAVTKTTGITDADVKGKPYFRQIAANLAGGLVGCDFAGKNIRYDLRVLACEMQRAVQPWSYTEARLLCADRLESIAQPRNLTALYKRYTGKDLQNAHNALADIRATAELIVAQLEQWPLALPRDLDQLHTLSWDSWIDTEGKFKFDEDGVPYVTFGKHADKPMTQVPVDYWDWILSKDFSAEIKKIAADAKLGKYPERR